MGWSKKLVAATTVIAGCMVFGIPGGFLECQGKPLVIERFPTAVDNSWEYRRTFSLTVYDTVHNDTIEYGAIIDSLHEEIEGMDTLIGWECYRLSHVLFSLGDTFPETWWWSHPDTALLWIAYMRGTKSAILTEPATDIRFWVGGNCFGSVRGLARYIDSARRAGRLLSALDTSYWFPPKKMFIFPLEVGKSWVAMTDPWLEEREVVGEGWVNVPAGAFLALKTQIYSQWMEEEDLWYKWISEEGIVKDTLHFRTMVTDSLGNPIGYSLGDNILELVGFRTGVEREPDNSEGVSVIYISPNPFHSATTIRYCLLTQTHIALNVYDSVGRLTRNLKDREEQPGVYAVSWDGNNNNGQETTSGMYFCVLEAGGSVCVEKLVFLH